MPRPSTYAQLLGSRQRQLLLSSVTEALREGTSLSTTLQQFIDGVTKTSTVKSVAGEITLGQIFVGLRDVDEPILRRGPGRPPKSAAPRRARRKAVKRKAAGRKPARRKPARRKVKAKVRAKARAKAPAKAKAVRARGGKRQRAGADTVKKRLDALHQVLKANGGWMKTGAIYDEVRKQRLFSGVVSNTVSQYLAKFADEPSKRVKKKGKRATSIYKAA